MSQNIDNKLKLIKEKVRVLDAAAKAYEQENREIMPDIEYDKLYDELLALENETGIVMSNSPTKHVGYELLTNLPKENHEKPMLSLDKTKDVIALVEWIGTQTGMLSWKLDGLTIVLTYAKGELVKAITRGSGTVGEVITNNAKVFKNLPVKIAYEGDLIVRGEAVISYSSFEKINSRIEEESLKYKNPRNLCSGSVRQLNNEITSERNVQFSGFSIVKADGIDFKNSRIEQMKWLEKQGFDVVDYKKVDKENIEEAVAEFANTVAENDLPSDGLVLIFDNIEYSESLGATAKFPRDAIAFKWRDEIKETELLEIEWGVSRTGLINPVAIFTPVELEGTTVSRASVHNISILENLKLGIGDTIGVYKANMIIPQIAENLTKSGNIEIPIECPVCSGETKIKKENDVKSLFCMNEDCIAKHIKSFTHFVERDALNIENLSEATLEKLIETKLIKDLADIFNIEKHKDEIVEMEGFGEKSYSKLVESINTSRKTNVSRLLYSLGIASVGKTTAKAICAEFNNDWTQIQNATHEQLMEINGIGDVIANAYIDFFEKEINKVVVGNILDEVEFEEKAANTGELIFDNISFVITGSVTQFANRNSLQEVIEEKGGKVIKAVSSKTNYLINNDALSNSSKNKKAKELGIQIITEDQFVKWIENNIEP